MNTYEPGDKVRTVCEIRTSTAYTHLKSFRAFAPSEANSRSIPEGTPGVVVEHIDKLIVSFHEPQIEGRAIDPSDVERIEEH